MTSANGKIRVLYSFPHKIGADRICDTAWHQVEGLNAAGADVTVFTGAVARPLPKSIRVRTTLAWNGIRVPYRALGSLRAFAVHDWRVARVLPKLAEQIDIVHTWPLGALQTLKTATELGIPTFLERCNAHTRFAYEAVKKECEQLGVTLPPDHEHAYKTDVLEKEEKEYRVADKLLCPSDFVAQTFLDHGFPSEKLARHQYGFDKKIFYPDEGGHAANDQFTMLFAGGCAPRKGLHYALTAWLNSSANQNGRFLIAGDFVPGYRKKLSSMLCHPSVQVLGFRRDIADLMRRSDVFILPSIEEGSALVTSEARGCGCVLLVSHATGAVCSNGEDSLVHPAGDVEALTRHLNMLYENRNLLAQLRLRSLQSIQEITWQAAGRRLLALYSEICYRTGHKRGADQSALLAQK